jgi:hypothetical protein
MRYVLPDGIVPINEAEFFTDIEAKFDDALIAHESVTSTGILTHLDSFS